jgi:glutaredoxin
LIVGLGAVFGLSTLGLFVYWVVHEPSQSDVIVAPLVEMPGAIVAEEDSDPVEEESAGAPAPAGKGTADPWAVLEDKDAGNVAATAEKEREKRIEAAMKQVRVTIYYAPWCPTCRNALAWLKSEGINHVAEDVEKSESAKRRWKGLSESGIVPKFEIGGKVLDGFMESSVKDAIREAAEEQVKD